MNEFLYSSFVCLLRYKYMHFGVCGVCLSVCVRVIFSLSVSNNEKLTSDGALSNVVGYVWGSGIGLGRPFGSTRGRFGGRCQISKPTTRRSKNEANGGQRIWEENKQGSNCFFLALNRIGGQRRV